MSELLVLQGPNLDLLGTREPETYGSTTLAELQADLDTHAAGLGLTLRHVQSSDEGALVRAVHQASSDGLAGAVVNAAAYTHTSVALRDAFLATGLPFIEVHISNVHAREAFRHHSYLSDVAIGVIVGLGVHGYRYAIDDFHRRVSLA